MTRTWDRASGRFHFHSLRHFHVAYLLFQGIELYTISKRLGHSNMMITAKKYAYLVDEYKAKSDRQIENAMDNLSRTTGQQLDNKMTFINFR
ncbi:tyrosine-type recombinase/integrase [Ligilactobacillus pobuzihii]|uniref:tyrosine-type recombinase/integrase n=1 Tax=Ligilactobacillus pobuzihii TaxID=449659 RepID=UPI0019D086DE|nr:tyrosine-type recombinase/integrase [Ligilactobacillus pobuzihii]